MPVHEPVLEDGTRVHVAPPLHQLLQDQAEHRDHKRDVHYQEEHREEHDRYRGLLCSVVLCWGTCRASCSVTRWVWLGMLGLKFSLQTDTAKFDGHQHRRCKYLHDEEDIFYFVEDELDVAQLSFPLLGEQRLDTVGELPEEDEAVFEDESVDECPDDHEGCVKQYTDQYKLLLHLEHGVYLLLMLLLLCSENIGHSVMLRTILKYRTV